VIENASILTPDKVLNSLMYAMHHPLYVIMCMSYKHQNGPFYTQ